MNTNTKLYDPYLTSHIKSYIDKERHVYLQGQTRKKELMEQVRREFKSIQQRHSFIDSSIVEYFLVRHWEIQQIVNDTNKMINMRLAE